MEFSKCLEKISGNIGIKFTLEGKDINYTDVFALDGFLPAILRRADQLSTFCMNQGLGVEFEDTSASRLGMKTKFNHEVSNAFRVMCVTEILYELLEASITPKVIALDGLMYD